MNTTSSLKIASKVEAAFKVYKIGAICQHLGMHRNTLKARLKTNCWNGTEIEALKKLGII